MVTLFAADAVPVAIEVLTITRLAAPYWSGACCPCCSAIRIIHLSRARGRHFLPCARPTMAMPTTVFPVVMTAVASKSARMGSGFEWCH